MHSARKDAVNFTGVIPLPNVTALNVSWLTFYNDDDKACSLESPCEAGVTATLDELKGRCMYVCMYHFRLESMHLFANVDTNSSLLQYAAEISSVLNTDIRIVDCWFHYKIEVPSAVWWAGVIAAKSILLFAT